MPDYLTDEEIVDAAIDELAARKMGQAIKDPDPPSRPAPNAQQLLDKFENALKAQDEPLVRQRPDGSVELPQLK